MTSVVTLFANTRRNEGTQTLSNAVHGTARNEVLHIDWIYICPAKKDGLNLIICVDLSDVVRTTPARTSNAEVTVEALMEWRALFCVQKILVSDMASYFLSETVKKFAEAVPCFDEDFAVGTQMG
jgi:hypothetical protein